LQAEVKRVSPDFCRKQAESGLVGLVGFGVDVLGLYSQKLDGGKGTGGTQLLPVHDDGRPTDNFGRLGVAFSD
jgi:hypothetical protein